MSYKIMCVGNVGNIILIRMYLFYFNSIRSLEDSGRLYASCIAYATIMWVTIILCIQYSLKGLLTYTAWMYEPRGKMSLRTKLWLVSDIFSSNKSIDFPQPPLHCNWTATMYSMSSIFSLIFLNVRWLNLDDMLNSNCHLPACWQVGCDKMVYKIPSDVYIKNIFNTKVLPFQM